MAQLIRLRFCEPERGEMARLGALGNAWSSNIFSEWVFASLGGLIL